VLTIRTCLTKMQQERERTLDDLTLWPEEALRLRHGTKAWCALELMDHLTRVERIAAATMLSHRGENRSAVWHHSLARVALFSIMRSSLRVSVPKNSPALLPALPQSLTVAATDWSAASSEAADVMSELSDTDQEAVFLHPIGGWMSAAHAANFLLLHQLHHRGQWARLRQSAFAV